ncbi:AAA family ATPase [Neolewinella lacunae]|uniref:AAA family ATPase n=1 Tax=Neolewinella lacunae TaxID=1517758 RepID=A0A923PM50_9BACT|nr:ATP-binding protein [Neolewinella lacunae]MBC6996570.1 AAA family ATPase [Neolewinella lacunae]MDN3634866.1 AAA family ATPase [Neolewinella lacunae]
MITSFSVENFRSIRDLQVLDLEAKPLQAAYPGLAQNVARVGERYEVLKAKVIYGANASGKSNLLMALSFFNFAVTLSWNPESIVLPLVEPFAWDPETNKAPSLFELCLLSAATPYRYGFTVSPEGEIVSEWLFGTPGKKEVPYFLRDENGIEVSGTHLKSVRKLLAAFDDESKFVSRKSLLLSVLGHFKNDEIKPVYEPVARMRIINGALATELDDKTVRQLLDEEQGPKIRELLARADIELGALRAVAGEYSPGLPSNDRVTLLGDVIKDRQLNLYVLPKLLPADNRLGFPIEAHLSKGTIKLILLAGSIIKTLEGGDCLIIDEFEAQMHTKLSQAIVRMFNSAESNPNNAQLIVATHDTNLLSPLLMRRDQITFVDKGKDGASSVYALSDVRGVRDGTAYEKEYLSGKYGGIPTVNEL